MEQLYTSSTSDSVDQNRNSNISIPYYVTDSLSEVQNLSVIHSVTEAEDKSSGELQLGSSKSLKLKKPSRKERHIGLLCMKFEKAANAIAKKNNGFMNLKEIVLEIKNEKRRIYDVLNVYESLEIVKRVDRAQYLWLGRGKLGDIMDKFLTQAEREKVFEKYERFAYHHVHNMLIENGNSTDALGSGIEPDGTNGFEKSTTVHKKRLGDICRRFLMILLAVRYHSSGRMSVCIDSAATLLFTNTTNGPSLLQARVRCRRLYDVCNILVAMGIVKKGFYVSARKCSTFIYCGPESETERISDDLGQLHSQPTGNENICHSSLPKCVLTFNAALQSDMNQQMQRMLSGSASERGRVNALPLRAIQNVEAGHMHNFVHGNFLQPFACLVPPLDTNFQHIQQQLSRWSEWLLFYRGVTRTADI